MVPNLIHAMFTVVFAQNLWSNQSSLPIKIKDIQE